MNSLLLLHGNHGIAEYVLFLGQLCFAVKYRKREVVVAKDCYHIPAFHLAAFFKSDFLYDASFERCHLNSSNRLHLPVQTDIVVKLILLDFHYVKHVLVCPVRGTVVPEHQPQHEHQKQGSGKIRYVLLSENGLKTFLFL